MSRSKWLTDVADGDASHDSDSKLTDWLSDFSYKPNGFIESSKSASEFGRCLHRAQSFDGGLAARDLTKLAQIKTDTPEIQELQVEVELELGLTERVLQIYRTLPVIVKTSANAERLKMEFRRIRN